MRIFFVFIILAWLPLLGLAQNLSLSDCWALARAHYPLLEGKKALAEVTDLNIQNVQTQWLPKIDLSGQATWQNDVPHVSGMTGFSIPTAPKDQYKVWLDVSQTLYDGGRVEARKQLEQAKGEVELQSVEVQLQEVDRKVTELFFSLLMLSQQDAQLQFMQEDLTARIGEATHAVENGVVLKSDLQSLKVENLHLMQRSIALQTSRKTMADNLALYIGQELDPVGPLTPPEVGLFLGGRPRAEYQLFELQQQQLGKSAALIQHDRRPSLLAFAQGGYGNPTYNMLNDAFDIFYLVGVRLKWTPWDWKQARRSKLVSAKQKEWVGFQQQTFAVNQSRAVRQMEGVVAQYLELMQKDDEILQLQTEITRDSRMRLQNGAITAADYLAELNAEARARLDKEIHNLQSLQGMALIYLNGK